MKNLLQGFDKYKSNVYANLKGHMQGLAEGQEPHTFLITCSDSRISTDQFVQASPGEIFVIRNAGNTIKPYDSEDPDSLAVTLEYGVVALNIPEIVVCGHVSCGAMDGILNLDKLDSLPLVQKGLRGVKEDFEFAAGLGAQSFPTVILKKGDDYYLVAQGYAKAEVLEKNVLKIINEL